MICQVLTKPGDVIVVEDPTYFLALEIFKRDHQLRVVAAPMDDEGLLVNDNLEKIFLEEKPKLLYIIPTHHNPTGRTLPTRTFFSLFPSLSPSLLVFSLSFSRHCFKL